MPLELGESQPRVLTERKPLPCDDWQMCSLTWRLDCCQHRLNSSRGGRKGGEQRAGPGCGAKQVAWRSKTSASGKAAAPCIGAFAVPDLYKLPGRREVLQPHSKNGRVKERMPRRVSDSFRKQISGFQFMLFDKTSKKEVRRYS